VQGLLRALTAAAHPATLARLWDAGLLRPQPARAVATVQAVPWLVGRGPSLGIVSQIHARSRPDRVAVHDRHGALTWAALEQRVNRAGVALERLGVGPGERVGLLLRNGREWVELAIAAQATGRVVAPLNTWAKSAELQAVAADTRPVVVFYDGRHAEQAAALDDRGMRLVRVGDDGTPVSGSHSYGELLAGASPDRPSPLPPARGSTAVVIQTSGTTGRPKGAARNVGVGQLGAFLGLLRAVPFRDDDVVLCPAPLFHAFGLVTFVVTAMLGGTLVLPDRFDPEHTLVQIARHQATAVSLVPVMIRRISDLPAGVRARHDLSSLRIVLASGAAMSQELRQRAMSVFGEVLYDLYGSTEAGWVTVAGPDDMRRRPGTVGRPVATVHVEVRDDAGQPLATGRPGEIHVRSGATLTRDTTTPHAADGTIATGDVGWLDEDGYLYIGGRADDMVIVGGENVFPTEVERVIAAVDGVTDVAVVGVPDEESGEVLAAFFVGEAEVGDVLEACRRELASYKVPRRLQRLHSLPRTSTGKIRVAQLRDSLS
jgi:fatty-acyl-CoA synthase